MILGYVYMKEEPGAPEVLEPALRDLSTTVGIAPRKMFVTMPKGKFGRDRKFSWDWFREAAPEAEDLGLWGGPARKDDVVERYRHGYRRSAEELTVRFHLRYLKPFDKRFQYPPPYYVLVPSSDDKAARAERVAAIEMFLVAASAPSHPLHGGIATIVDPERAHDEVTIACEPGFAPEGGPVKGRLWFDAGKLEELWLKARRAYWTTILGPDLAAAAGGAEAARATGATRVETKGDCLVVQSTDDINDFLAPDWPSRVAKIRRWIWPHTIQNPADAPEEMNA